jgi:F0F1-type ATP synthase epsilon subunit
LSFHSDLLWTNRGGAIPSFGSRPLWQNHHGTHHHGSGLQPEQDIGKPYEIANGLRGVQRDTVFLLINCIQEPKSIRQLMGVSTELPPWISHPHFLWARYIALSVVLKHVDGGYGDDLSPEFCYLFVRFISPDTYKDLTQMSCSIAADDTVRDMSLIDLTMLSPAWARHALVAFENKLKECNNTALRVIMLPSLQDADGGDKKQIALTTRSIFNGRKLMTERSDLSRARPLTIFFSHPKDYFFFNHYYRRHYANNKSKRRHPDPNTTPDLNVHTIIFSIANGSLMAEEVLQMIGATILPDSYNPLSRNPQYKRLARKVSGFCSRKFLFLMPAAFILREVWPCVKMIKIGTVICVRQSTDDQPKWILVRGGYLRVSSETFCLANTYAHVNGEYLEDYSDPSDERIDEEVVAKNNKVTNAVTNTNISAQRMNLFTYCVWFFKHKNFNKRYDDSDF